LLFQAKPAIRSGFLPRTVGESPCSSYPTQVQYAGPSSQLCPGHHHVDIAAAALRANQAPSLFGHWRLWSIPASLISRVGFAQVTTCFAQDVKPELSRGGAFECHQRASVGLHLTTCKCSAYVLRPSADFRKAHHDTCSYPGHRRTGEGGPEGR